MFPCPELFYYYDSALHMSLALTLSGRYGVILSPPVSAHCLSSETRLMDGRSLVRESQ